VEIIEIWQLIVFTWTAYTALPWVVFSIIFGSVLEAEWAQAITGIIVALITSYGIALAIHTVLQST
jgi:uncharacterized protein YggT (Ycf19 family)